MLPCPDQIENLLKHEYSEYVCAIVRRSDYVFKQSMVYGKQYEKGHIQTVDAKPPCREVTQTVT